MDLAKIGSTVGSGRRPDSYKYQPRVAVPDGARQVAW